MNFFTKIFFSSFLFWTTTFFAQASYTETEKLYDDTQVALIEIEVAPEAVDYMFSHPDSDSLHLCKVHFKNKYFDETIDSVGIRIRGNTSRDARKKSFKLSINGFVRGRTFHGVDKINLNGEHNDPSIIRSKLCWDLFQSIGMKASHASHVAVYINGKYYGLYISVEHIDDEFLKKNFQDPSGNLWKCLWPADLLYKGDDPDLYKERIGDRRIYDLRSNEDEDDYSQLARLIKVINLTPFSAFPDSLEKILNVYEAIKYFAVNILVGSWDDYRFLKNNYYLYYEPLTKKFHWIPYDYDNTFGIDWFGYDWSTIDPYDYPTIDDTPRPFTERLFKVPEYRNLFTHFLDFYSQNVFPLKYWGKRLDSLQEMIAPFAQADSFRTLDYGFTYDDFWNSYTDGDYSNKHVKMGLKRFVNRRVESLKEELKYYVAKPFVYLIKAVPKNLTLKDSVRIDASIFSNPEITSAIVKVKNNTTGIEKSYSLQKCGVTSTKLVEEFDKWSVVLPPLNKGENEVRISVTNTAGLSATFPRGAKFFLNVSDTTKSPLVINEFLAINDKTNPDEYGEYDDWVEIFNRGESEIDLGGYFLTDSKGKLSKWQFPQGTVISPNGFLLVWCDKDNQAGLHTNFKLSGSGEFVALVSADGTTVLDSISFGKQTADVSSGRFPDGGEEWKFLKPTPNQPNVLLRVRNKFQPSTFSLSIFPNPVVASENGSVKVEYSLSGVKLANRKYSLAVFNALGQKVKTLRNGIAVAGKQTFSYDISKLASGVYFVVLKIGSRIKTQKFLLLR